MEPSRLGYRNTLIVSWLNEHIKMIDDDQRALLLALVDWIFGSILDFVRKECIEVTGTSDSNLVFSFLNLLECMFKECKDLTPRVVQGSFLFATTWSIGASVNEVGREKFDLYLRSVLKGEKAPKPEIQMDIELPEDSIYDYLFEANSGSWIPWLETATTEFIIAPKTKYDDILVPTLDTLRYSHLLKLLARQSKHVLFIGQTGTGKSMYVRDVLMNGGLDKEIFTPVFINFSAQTSAFQTQEILESKLDKRRKGIFGPPPGRKAVIFVDDLNMPAKEQYGAQPPIELLRQWMDHGGWYNLKENSMQEMVDLQFVSAMGPSGGGKNSVTPRLLRHFNLISIASFNDQTLSRIFSTILDWHFKSNSFAHDIVHMTSNIVSATTDLYRSALSNLLPTPKKSHYTFNLRDFARIIQGILLIRPENASEQTQMIHLWLHEAYRVFYDRLVDDHDRKWMFSFCKNSIKKHFNTEFNTAFKTFDFNDDGEVEDDDLRSLIFGTHLSPRESTGKAYKEISKLSELSEFIDKCLLEHNAVSKKPLDLVMFRFAIEHLSRISRVLQQPRGNILLAGVGGSGRQSLSRLAAYIAEFDLFQIEISKNYGLENWHEDLKKVLKIAGGMGKPVIFLFSDTQIQEESFLEDISNILNSGEVPNLYATDEKQELFELIRAQYKTIGKVLEGTPTHQFSVFADRCRENLHVCLAMSPVGEAFRIRLRKFPSLVNCCTIDWFSDWPSDALEMVARKFLNDINVPENNRDDVVFMCKFLHSSTQIKSQKLMAVERRYNYVTPPSYLELIKTFKALLSVHQTTVQRNKNRYVNGLEKLNFAQNSVAKMQVDLGAMQPELVKTQKETDLIMIQIEKESKEVQITKTIVQRDEEVATIKAAEASAMKNDCESQLAEAIPALNSAIAALNTLKPADITILKSMKSPPSGVRLVMEAVCVMRNVKPVKIPDPAGGNKKIDDYWGPSKTLMSDMKFLDNLRTYDKDNIPPATMKIIRTKFVDNPEFNPEIISSASSAAEGLCRWVLAMEIYDRIAKVVGPKKVFVKF